jgi:sugar lactone lactonase YvrE
LHTKPKLLAGGLAWPESPRWNNGELLISDVHNFRLAKVKMDGTVDTVCTVEGRPAGMDLAEDGSLLLATGVSRELLRVDPVSGATRLLADMKDMAKAYLNDLITHASGWSWVGDTGFRFGVDEPSQCGGLWAFHPAHGLKLAANDIFFPNGMVITPDGLTLYLAETFGRRITAFDIGENGTLINRRVHAILPAEPDGLCLDAEGCLWVPLLFQGDFLRIAPDGEEIGRISFPGKNAIACVAAAHERKTLFLCICTMDRSDPHQPIRHGEIYTVELSVPGAGRP